jgi:hypothetical protein
MIIFKLNMQNYKYFSFENIDGTAKPLGSIGFLSMFDAFPFTVGHGIQYNGY